MAGSARRSLNSAAMLMMYHRDGTKHRHGDDVGGQRLAAQRYQLVAIDGGSMTDHAAGDDGAVRSP